MRLMTALLAGAATLAGTACSNLDIPDFNNPSLEDLQTNPTPAGVNAAAVGLLLGARRAAGDFATVVGHFGREGYSLNVAQGGLNSYLVGPLDPGNFLVGPQLWHGEYRTVRTANVLLNALDVVAGVTDEQKEATRGFAKTVKAYALLMVAATRDTFGLPVAVDIEPSGDPAPIATKAEAYAYIRQLLDEGQTHLQAGGGAFPFQLPSGFAGFDTPATFVPFNRALRARVDVYLMDWAAALTSLAGSFVDSTASLEDGVYHSFGTGSGDEPNDMFAPAFLYADTTIRTRAQARADASLDLRAQNKVRVVTEFSLGTVRTNLQYTIYDSPSAPLAWIRNEELLLLRAEANLGLDNQPDALLDINTVRVKSGGLDPITPGDWATRTPDERLTELLYNRRMSLTWEWGHTWLDMRRHGRLGQIRKNQPTEKIYEVIPFPIDECLARDPAPVQPCAAVVGI
jgi:hypothetical protein